MKPRIHYTKPSITELEVEYATDAARNGWGDQCYAYIARFEEAFKAHLCVKHAIATSSCTGAIHMGLAALGVGPGDEVIMADINWIASAAPITYLGATPVLVDILPDTWCIDPHQIRQAITSNTKAIIAVHLYGNLCELNQLLRIGAEHGIPIVEDAAEAIGSKFDDRSAGSMGQFGTFSFHGTKTITTGEGGMFVTNDDDLYESVLTLSNHGRSRHQKKQFWPDRIGFKYKLSNVQAAIGCAQVERIEELIAEKRRIFNSYRRELANTPVQLNPLANDCVEPGYWMVNAVFPADCMDLNRREALIQRLDVIGADARVFFWPLSSLGLFKKRHDTPVSYDVSSRSINLPAAFGISDDQIRAVSSVIREFAKHSQEGVC